jgi:3-oxoadipate enol-lactonase
MSLPDAKIVDLEIAEIAYREKGRGPALMFVHGLGGGSAAWSDQFDAFSDRYRVIAWDGPGYGSSGDFLKDTPMVSDYVDVLARFLDALAVEGAHLVGHSFGGIIVSAYNRRYPARVLSLTLLQAVIGSGRLEPGKLQELYKARRAEIESMAPKDFAEFRARKALAAGAPPALVARAAKVSYSLRSRGYLQAYQAMCAANIFDELAGITAPALVIAGENDSTAPQENCRSIAEAVPGVRFYTIEGTGHVIYMEATERLNACLGEFLTGVG